MEMKGGGNLELRREGSRVRLRAERQNDGAGLYKVWLRGRQGREVLLGTLVPEKGDLLGLDRVVAVQELERRGCWPVEEAEARLAFSFGPRKNDGWTVISQLPPAIGDGLLRRSLRGTVLHRRGEGEGFLLAAPFQRDCPVALEPIFCLSAAETVGGRLCLVWAFDGEGRPRLPASPPAKVQDKY